MKRKIKIIILLFIILVLLSGIYLLIKEKRKSIAISNAILNLLNNNKISKYFDDDALEAIVYAKTKNMNKHDITDFINYYIDTITKSVIAKINKVDQEGYMFYYPYGINKFIGYDEYVKIANTNRDIAIYGLEDFVAKFIIKNITDEDILDYNNGLLQKKIIEKIQGILILDKGKWYIDLDEDMRIDLPYNVYIDYVTNIREFKNDIKKFLDVKIPLYELKKITDDYTNINVFYKFENAEGNIVETNKKLKIKIDKENQYKIDVDTITSLYSSYGYYAKITAGQHDYDEARERLMQEEYELGLSGPGPMNAWEEEALGITSEPSKVMTVEEIYESLINKYNESTASDAKEKVALFEDLLRHTIEGSK